MPVSYTHLAGLGLIVLGFGLLAAELLTPTFGILGVGGVVAFIAGGLLLFDRDVPGLGVPLPLLFGLAASSAAVVLLGGGMAPVSYTHLLALAVSAGVDGSVSGVSGRDGAPGRPIDTGVAAPSVVAGAIAAMWLAYRM